LDGIAKKPSTFARTKNMRAFPGWTARYFFFHAW
jgi:hypothetical protein